MGNKNASKNIRLGIFVSVGITLFIIAIYFIGAKQQMFTKTIRLSGFFTDISGLQKGNNVRFSGINVGTVDEIIIVSDSLVRVDVIVEKKIQKFIKKDALAAIGSEGLMGNKVLNITPGLDGSKIIIQDGGLLKTKQLASMDAIMTKMDSVAGNAVFITGDLKGLMANLHEGKGTLGKLFMDETMASDMGETLTNVKKSTATLNDDLKALQSNFLFKKGIAKKEDAIQAKADTIAAEKANIPIDEYLDEQKKEEKKKK
jgi:phospholipid/cholesterol/gamma-HCH transport system substrate-binding protein